ncbi:MAG: YbhB/YbcL family Raf kinase inhibitor-like protein [archaeon]
MNITSPDFTDGERIPERFTADGINVNPELIISEIPEETQSLVLIVDDPDAIRVCGFTWVHWVLFNIPVTNSFIRIPENTILGTPGSSTYKKPEYLGPNPPKKTGVHNYYFKVYAVDKILNLPEMAPLTYIMEDLENHIIEKSQMFGTYERR